MSVLIFLFLFLFVSRKYKSKNKNPFGSLIKRKQNICTIFFSSSVAAATFSTPSLFPLLPHTLCIVSTRSHTKENVSSVTSYVDDQNLSISCSLLIFLLIDSSIYLPLSLYHQAFPTHTHNLP